MILEIYRVICSCKLSGFPHLLENLEKWEYTWKTWKNHGILQKIIKIMKKLHGTWKNIWVDYKSLHARGRPQVLCACLLSGGWNKCSILCMHWNGPRVNLNCQTCVHIAHLQRGKVGSSVWPERSVRGLVGRGEGSPSATLCASIAAGRPSLGSWRRQIDTLGP